ncbi:MAG: glycosyltransferase family 39 protein [Deltaproteobacteria bacterium]|nr:glycosyltransferase family 39 protein [Deltaproteobacteria bacterium]
MKRATNALRRPEEVVSHVVPVTDAPDSRLRLRHIALDLLLLAPLLIFVCFYNLNDQSIHHVDEATHVRVTQEMLRDGQWWDPKSFGKLYFNKPPFKMWLTAIPVMLLGESNFSYRVIDGLCGVGTALLVYGLSLLLFRSRLAGIFSVIVLLSCRSYVFVHGVRTATQDAMLILLATTAMIAGYKFFEVLRTSAYPVLRSRYPEGVWRYAVVGGVAIGCAVLTKNVAGFLPLAMLGIFALLSGDVKRVLERGKLPFLAVCLLSVLLPALYIVPRYFAHPEITLVMFGQEVADRVAGGYHNQDSFTFYFRRLFRYRAGVPPELIYAGYALAAYWIVRRYDRRYLFLAIWGAFPVLLFTFIPSRLTWYMAPAFPAMSVLAGIAMAKSVEGVSQAFRRKTPTAIGAGAVCLVLLGFFAYGLTKNYLFVTEKVIWPNRGRLPFDRMTDEIRARNVGAEKAPLVTGVFRAPKFGRNEQIYVDMHPAVQQIASTDELAARATEGKPDFLFARAADFAELAAVRPFRAYRFLAPANHRFNWAIMLSYLDMPGSKEFTPVTRTFDFGQGSPQASFLYGWGSPGRMEAMTIRNTYGDRSAVVVEGDTAMRQLGTRFLLNAGYIHEGNPEHVSVEITLNGERIGEIRRASKALRTLEFDIPPGIWIPGNNVLAFRYSFEEGKPVDARRQLFMFNWAAFELKFPTRPQALAPTEIASERLPAR